MVIGAESLFKYIICIIYEAAEFFREEAGVSDGKFHFCFRRFGSGDFFS